MSSFSRSSILGLLLVVGSCPGVFIARTEAASLVQMQGEVRQIKGQNYEATIASDGCLTNLKVNGQEFLRPGIDISRGTYLHQNGALKLTNITQPADNVVSASNDRGSLRYEFGDTSITITAANATDQPMPLFMVLDPAYGAMINGAGDAFNKVLNRDETTTSWFAGKTKVKLTGSNRLWGPWTGDSQIWEATLAPHETRKVTLETGTATDAELAKIAEAGYNPLVERDLTVLSPRNLQVIQRQTRTQGEMLVSGRVTPNCDKVEVRVSGTSLTGNLAGKWQSVPFTTQTHSFYGQVPVPAGGWYRVEVHALKGKTEVASASVAKVGIGEVFVGAGQSNSTNYGEVRTQPTSGMVSSFNGTDWQLANDPQPGTHDKSTGGSFWPAFGDTMYAKYKVPIGVATTGHGGTNTNQWAVDGELFNWTMNRIYQLGPHGFRAVLWHQGESDVDAKTSTDDYISRMTAIIRTSKQYAGWEFPWFVARVSYHNPNQVSFPVIRDAQKTLWDKGIALEGPDTDTLTGDNRDTGGHGIHLSAKGLKAHGEMWAAKVSAYLDPILNP